MRDPVNLKFTPENVRTGQSYPVHRKHNVRMGNTAVLEYIEQENAIEKFLQDTLGPRGGGADRTVQPEQQHTYQKELQAELNGASSKDQANKVHWAQALVKQDIAFSGGRHQDGIGRADKIDEPAPPTLTLDVAFPRQLEPATGPPRHQKRHQAGQARKTIGGLADAAAAHRPRWGPPKDGHPKADAG